MQKTGETKPIYLDPGRPAEERARDLAARLTLEEKIRQLLHFAPAVPRLGILDYVWQNECLHGVARAGIATVFPQAIGLAATFDGTIFAWLRSLLWKGGQYHEFDRRGDRNFKGLTY